jgi:hypothetical protein
MITWVAVAALAGLIVWAFIEAVRAEPAVVGSVATAVVGLFGVLWQQRRSEEARLREAHRARMTPVYDDLLKMFLDNLGSGGGIHAEAEDFMKDLKGRQLLLGASTEMIRAFNDWQRSTVTAQADGNSMSVIFAWEDLLRAIRRDLGHNDADLQRGELLRVFITDIDDHVAAAV